jgi:sulfite reductase beta subunit-like hemoprotein
MRPLAQTRNGPERIPVTPTGPSKSSRSAETFADEGEISALVENLGRFERGEIDADTWRAYRVARGVYGQRQDGIHMLRIKLPQGSVTADQLRALADTATRYSRGFGHITTRQNFQLHFVRPADVEPAVRRLAEVGITTSGAGGNTVRNVVACPFGGIAPNEVFDTTAYAEAFTRHFLRHPLGDALPRKFKVAFEGCSEDHVPIAIQDLGFRARVRVNDGKVARGFAISVAGGTSTQCTSASPLLDFLPAGEILALGEAIVRVFHAHGDRVNRQRNRLKFLVRALGFERFQALVFEQLELIRAEGTPVLPLDPEQSTEVRTPREPLPPLPVPLPSDGAWEGFLATNVQPQRQDGYSSVVVSLPLGDVTASQLEVLADLSEAFGEGSVRFTNSGQILLRWVSDNNLRTLFRALASLGLGRDGAGSAADVVACPGAEVCRLAVTQTRAVARLVECKVRTALGPIALQAKLSVHLSGCPNGCSQHHLAAIGLQGGVRKLGGRAVPQYSILVGGHVEGSEARFGEPVGKVPSRRIPEAVTRLVSLYLAERRAGEPAGAFFVRALDRARETVAPFEDLRLEDATAEDFIEPGSAEAFLVDVKPGECAA